MRPTTPSLLTTALLIAIAQPAFPASQATTDSLPFNPRDGETVVFLGDSITHQSLYSQYLENFFITRYPERRIRFHNAGVGGDSAADALARFDTDVAAHRPAYVTVHLGMNDGRYEDFDVDTVATYRAGLTALLDRIESIGARPILLSPTMFDHAVARTRADDKTWRFGGKTISTNYNALLGYFTGLGMETASRRGIPFVNWWAPLNRLTLEQRRSRADFTMIWDAIHPQAAGQVVMVSEFLSQLGVEQSAADKITLLRQDGKLTGSTGVRDLRMDEDGKAIRFVHRTRSLPWIIPVKHSGHPLKWRLPSDGRTGYALAEAGHNLSVERLTLIGLPPGHYELSIDGQVIGIWDDVVLGTAIEIQENEHTPQYQQALKVAHLNRKRTDEFVRPARDLAGRLKGLRNGKGTNNASRIATLLEQMSELETKADEMLTEIYEAAQPIERHWIVRKTAP